MTDKACDKTLALLPSFALPAPSCDACDDGALAKNKKGDTSKCASESEVDAGVRKGDDATTIVTDSSSSSSAALSAVASPVPASASASYVAVTPASASASTAAGSVAAVPAPLVSFTSVLGTNFTIAIEECREQNKREFNPDDDFIFQDVLADAKADRKERKEAIAAAELQAASCMGRGIFYSVHRKTAIHSSKIHGRGLFALSTVSAGTLVWEDQMDDDDGPFIPYSQVPPAVSDARLLAFWRVCKYSAAGEPLYGGPRTIEAVERDASHFMNHSCNPNCVLSGDSRIITRRVVSPSEELTIDYATLSHSLAVPLSACNCGAIQCRSNIRDTDHLLPELVRAYPRADHWARFWFEKKSKLQSSALHTTSTRLVNDGKCFAHESSLAAGTGACASEQRDD